MNLGFWEKLKKTTPGENAEPIIVLAPMADVTDAAFRRIIAKYSKMGNKNGGPAVMWTEFVSADGLCSPGRKKLLIDLKYSELERPIVAQLFSANPEKMKEAAELVQKLGFDGLDINMGCPDRGVEKQGAGASLIKNPKLAKEIIMSAMAGAPKLPVSVKTRIGYNKNELETWLPAILECQPAVVTIHARTRKEMSDVPANWDTVSQAVKIRDSLNSKTLIFGNGDVIDMADARKKAKETGADGVMLGRAIFGNPWLFAPEGSGLSQGEGDYVKNKLKVMVEHTKLFHKLFKGVKNFAVMKKHFKAYVSGFDGAKELRARLMETESASEVTAIIKKYLKNGEV